MTQLKCVQLDHVLQMYHLRYLQGHRPLSIREPPVESATSITVQHSSLLVAATVLVFNKHQSRQAPREDSWVFVGRHRRIFVSSTKISKGNPLTRSLRLQPLRCTRSPMHQPKHVMESKNGIGKIFADRRRGYANIKDNGPNWQLAFVSSRQDSMSPMFRLI